MSEEKKVFTKNVLVGTSKEKGVKFLYIKTKAGELVFINLVKDSKKYQPKIADGVKSLDVSYTSYNSDREKKQMTLFNVQDVIANK